MNLEHIIKISDFIFPVIRKNEDESIIVESAGFRGRVIPGQKKMIFTDRRGRVRSVRVRL